jgi:phospholipase/carboxylesterase
MSPELETLERVTGPEPNSAVIWLHGLGADGHDFLPIVEELALAPHQVRFVFPHAPVRPVTLNGGLPMRAWFDVVSLQRDAAEDLAGIRASAAAVDALITREAARGIPPERVVLGGFSQGGAIALYCGTRQLMPLAGMVGLSTYLPGAGRLAAELVPANLKVPVFMAHGEQDPVVAAAWGQRSREALAAAGFSISWHSYRMPHAVCGQERADLGGWLRGVLGGLQSPG